MVVVGRPGMRAVGLVGVGIVGGDGRDTCLLYRPFPSLRWGFWWVVSDNYHYKQ